MSLHKLWISAVAFLAIGRGLPATATVLNSCYSGSISSDNTVVTQTFTLTGPGLFNVDITTASYGGGTDTCGNSVKPGGFATELTLFDASGNQLSNANSLTGNLDPKTNLQLDSALNAYGLTAGTYTVALTEYGNNSLGNWNDGFSAGGNTKFTSTYGCSQGDFCDPYGDNRNGSYDFSITADYASPEPASVALCGLGVLSLAMFRRRRK